MCHTPTSRAQRLTWVQVLIGQMQSALREYRALKLHVGPWRNSFWQQHRRQPLAQDALAFGGKEFRDSYVTFLELRMRLFADLPGLRDQAARAIEGTHSPKAQQGRWSHADRHGIAHAKLDIRHASDMHAPMRRACISFEQCAKRRGSGEN